ncbi:MAG: metallophosphoesterase family protein [Deltaproteobacteria bacterium]|nr:metallophosphoesterase family protein [Deltaproteobacteria bacterium]
MRKACASLLLVWLAVGCNGSSSSESDAGTDAGCRPEARYRVPCGEADWTFHVGPYLGHTTTSSVAIGWETLEAGSTRVEYGLDASYGGEVQAEPGTMHQVEVEGLEQGQLYHYRACTDARCTADLTFASAPGPDVPLRFAVYGDCQDRPEVHEQVVEQLLAAEPSLALVVGDTVGDGRNREEFKSLYFDPARRLAHHLPRYAAIGNHDRKDVEAVHYRDYNILPEDPDVPQAETSYSFVYGNAFFLVFDNTLDHYDLFFPPVEGIDPPLWAWMCEQAASEPARAAQWRFAFAHYPADSSCYGQDHEYGPPDSAMRAFVLPMLWENGFHAYFHGHMHCYERFEFDGHLVIDTGGGGGTLEDESNCTDAGPSEARFHSCVYHGLIVDLGCDRAEVSARDVAGQVIDRVWILPDGSCEEPGQ